ncbi:MAG TPA: hypothetical protein VEK79_18035 [Thermoanaerobaculia bacterium]|nr:hypothetical protein [Thermoanaerobaculia bacterium]
MIRNLGIIICIALSSALFADSADIEITSLTTGKSSVSTGELLTVTMRWRNNGPDIANDVIATLGIDSGATVLVGLGKENWPCEPVFAGNGFQCRGFLAPGGDALLTATMFARSDMAAPFTIVGRVVSSTSDPRPANNVSSLTLPLTPSAATADLAIGPETQSHLVRSGTQLSLPLIVRNNGSEAVNNVHVSLSFDPSSRLPMSASGAGWSCLNPTHSPWLLTCRHPTLDPGTAPAIIVNATAPASGDLRLYARVAAANLNDPLAGNAATADIRLGGPGQPQQSRLLVPIPPGVTPGINGARWTAQATGLRRAPIGMDPILQPFDLAELLADGGLGQFFISALDTSKINANMRVWDETRQTQTAGSEIPLAREDDFTSGTLHILGIPIAPHYRHTLRVYDLDGRGGARIAVRLYADQELTPRASAEVTLSLFAAGRPASTQLDPLQLGSMSGAAKMRIEIEPLNEGLKLWSFVSVTNNDTHHVTTFTMQ